MCVQELPRLHALHRVLLQSLRQLQTELERASSEGGPTDLSTSLWANGALWRNTSRRWRQKNVTDNAESDS